MVSVRTKDELRSLIQTELHYHGADADLNFIDTSKITDMSRLFEGLNVRNIKIDKWDVSNVTDMSYMFFMCEDFNADLSKWNASKIMAITDIFTMATKMEMKEELQPKFNNLRYLYSLLTYE